MSIKPDYRPDNTGKSRRQVRFYGFLIITLILLGLFSSLLAYISNTPPGETEMTLPPAQPKPALTPSSQSPASQPDPAVRQPDKPKYDFYKLLPERQLDVQDNQGASGPGPPSNGPTTAIQGMVSQQNPQTALQSVSKTQESLQAGDRYIVQVGSFGNQADADRLKASIATLGVTATIETDAATGDSPMYRVRIGPIVGVDQVNALRQLLQNNHIQSVSIKAR
ncbi:MAG: SPOR domain-containing protein [Candidatus Competibacteraceae bacterium]|nr:SPOR domain-containing protein [Candidatus Competibacteraceae bacterium]